MAKTLHGSGLLITSEWPKDVQTLINLILEEDIFSESPSSSEEDEITEDSKAFFGFVDKIVGHSNDDDDNDEDTASQQGLFAQEEEEDFKQTNHNR
jgi:hypothetical protein